jgi:DNA-binding transcriptional ArsR family regulator
MKGLSGTTVSRIAGRGRALGEPTRVRILGVLARGELTVGHIADAIGSRQSTASKHLQILFNAGLLNRRRSAKRGHLLAGLAAYSRVHPAAGPLVVLPRATMNGVDEFETRWVWQPCTSSGRARDTALLR